MGDGRWRLQLLAPKIQAIASLHWLWLSQNPRQRSKTPLPPWSGVCLDWAINHNRAKLYGVHLPTIIDCYGLRFILSDDGPNAVILLLKMRLMLWAMDLYIVLAGFWSQRTPFLALAQTCILTKCPGYILAQPRTCAGGIPLSLVLCGRRICPVSRPRASAALSICIPQPHRLHGRGAGL